MVSGVEDAAFDEHTLAGTQIDSFLVESLEPRLLMSIGKEEEQALDLNARAILQEVLQTNGAQIGEAAKQGIDLLKGLVIGQLIEQLEYCALWRRQSQGPIPLAPVQRGYIGAVQARHIPRLTGIDIPFETAEACGDGVVFEEPPIVVIDKLDLERQFLHPCWRRFRTVEMNGRCRLREMVGVSLQFERGAPTDDERRIVEDGLKRYDDLLPAQSSTGPAKYTARGLFEPAGFHIEMLELGRVPLGLQPSSIDQQSFGKLAS